MKKFITIFVVLLTGLGLLAADTPPTCSDLIISQYVEGKVGNNKYIELYNGTAKDIDLSDYTLQQNNNGGSSWGYSTALSGTIKAGDVYIFYHSGCGTELTTFFGGISTKASSVTATNNCMGFNGNDPIGLFKGDDLVDVIGTFGSTDDFGKDVNMTRKCTATAPKTTYDANDWESTSFSSSFVESEYTAGAGSHCGAPVSGGGSQDPGTGDNENSNFIVYSFDLKGTISDDKISLTEQTPYFYIEQKKNSGNTVISYNNGEWRVYVGHSVTITMNTGFVLDSLVIKHSKSSADDGNPDTYTFSPNTGVSSQKDGTYRYIKIDGGISEAFTLTPAKKAFWSEFKVIFHSEGGSIPTAVLSGTALDFNTITTGESKPLEFSIIANEATSLTNVSVNAPFLFSESLPLSFTAGQTRTVSFIFSPTVMNIYSETATFTFSDNSTCTMTLTGKGFTPEAEVTPSEDKGIPTDYYASAEDKTGYTLKTALYNIIKDHTRRSYDQLWTDFESTDARSDGYVWDMYGNCIYSFSDRGSSSTTECTGGFNREHSFPKSWFGVSEPNTDPHPAGTDLFHLYPTDVKVNATRSNYPFGEVSNPTYTSFNGSKLGPNTSSTDFTGTVFEPADRYKGDFARTYFYMATRYENEIADWKSNHSCPVCNGTSEQALEDWVVALLLKWHENDPVSQKEIDRNKAVYALQGNRNPFIDHPEWVEAIWGDNSGSQDPTPTTYTINTAVQPEDAGTVNGGGSYNENTTVTLSATANSGYTFVKWSDDESTNPTRTITVNATTAAVTYTAIFEEDEQQQTSYTIAQLRAQNDNNSTEYTISSVCAITGLGHQRNQKWIQDASGAGILIDDNTGNITGTYIVGDNIKNLKGRLTTFNGMREFVPTADATKVEPATVTVTPAEIAPASDGFQSVLSPIEGKLVTIKGCYFTSTGNFADATEYTATCNGKELKVRTYVKYTGIEGKPIPATTQEVDITGIVIVYSGVYSIWSRSFDDIVEVGGSQDPGPTTVGNENSYQFNCEGSYNDTKTQASLENSFCTMLQQQGGNTSNPIQYVSPWRFYKNNTITISMKHNLLLSKVVIYHQYDNQVGGAYSFSSEATESTSNKYYRTIEITNPTSTFTITNTGTASRWINVKLYFYRSTSTPSDYLETDVANLDYGYVAPGVTKNLPVNIITLDPDIQLTGISTPDNDQFTTTPSLPLSFSDNLAKELKIGFAPQKEGDFSGNITLTFSNGSTKTLAVTAKGVSKANYYNAAEGKTGFALKTALYNIIKDHTTITYNELWNAYKTTDTKADGITIWDMYSNCEFTTSSGHTCSDANNCQPCEGFNREHSFVKSWFGGEIMPMFTDVFHVYPTDIYVNGNRGTYPFGEVAENTPTLHENTDSKIGPNVFGTDYAETVFEPADEYKGDFARTYFYMATRYENLIAGWKDAHGCTVCNGTSDTAFKKWVVDLFLKWNKQDPVSEKETARNEAVYAIQGNRNPFIDHPEWVAAIWDADNGGNQGGQGGSTPMVNLRLEEITAPISGCGLTDREAVKILVMNKGNEKVTQIVVKGCLGNDEFTETLAVDIEPSDTQEVTLTKTLDLSQKKNHGNLRIEAYIPEAEDLDSTDNAQVKNILSGETFTFGPTLSYEADFTDTETDAWNEWTVTKDHYIPNNYAFHIPRGSYITSRCFNLKQNMTYRLKVDYAILDEQDRGVFEVRYGKYGTDISTWQSIYRDNSSNYQWIDKKIKFTHQEADGEYALALISRADPGCLLQICSLEEVYDYDLVLDGFSQPTEVPVDLANGKHAVLISVKNNGRLTAETVKITVTTGQDVLMEAVVKNLESDHLRYLDTILSFSGLQADAETEFTAKAVIVGHENDDPTANNETVRTLKVGDDVLAYDKATPDLPGWGSNNGQAFTFGAPIYVNKTDTLTGIQAMLAKTNPYQTTLTVYKYFHNEDSIESFYSTEANVNGTGGLETFELTPMILEPGYYVLAMSVVGYSLIADLDNGCFFEIQNNKITYINYWNGRMGLRAVFGHKQMAEYDIALTGFGPAPTMIPVQQAVNASYSVPFSVNNNGQKTIEAAKVELKLDGKAAGQITLPALSSLAAKDSTVVLTVSGVQMNDALDLTAKASITGHENDDPTLENNILTKKLYITDQVLAYDAATEAMCETPAGTGYYGQNGSRKNIGTVMYVAEKDTLTALNILMKKGTKTEMTIEVYPFNPATGTIGDYLRSDDVTPSGQGVEVLDFAQPVVLEKGYYLFAMEFSDRCMITDYGTGSFYAIDGNGALSEVRDWGMPAIRAVFGAYSAPVDPDEEIEVAEPVFSEPSGAVLDSGSRVAVTCATTGVKIYYTQKKDSMPNTLYTGPLTLTADTMYVAAVALREGRDTSEIVRAVYYRKQSEPVQDTDTVVPTPTRYTVTVLANDSTYGSVKGGGTFDEGTEITIEAIAKEGYVFVKWHDNDTANPRTVKVTCDTVFTAIFEKKGGGVPTAAEATVLQGVKVYPNPGDGHFMLTLPVDAFFELFNAGGIRLRGVDLKAGTYTYTLTQSGVYFIRLTSGSGYSLTRKVIVR